jgi:hypothetical protein
MVGATSAAITSFSSLGKDAMSDDESDPDIPKNRPNRPFKVQNVPNRNPTISQFVRTLDQIGAIAGPITLPAGRNRVFGAIGVSDYRLKTGLPEGAYDPVWLASLPAHRRATIENDYKGRTIDLPALEALTNVLDARMDTS